MTGTADERLIVMLEARIAEFEKRMKKAEGTGTRAFRSLQRGSKTATAQMEADMARSTGRINQALATTSNRIGAFAGGILGGVLATAVASLTTNLRQTVTQIAAVGDQARRAGVDAQSFQELAHAARANRIEVDSLVDGLKEMSLRADEFVTTGGGSAAEALRRLGYDAADLARRLEKPDELFLDIIGRMEGLDRAAQIRIADEVFGGTGGERFVQLLGQGQAGIRQLMAEAQGAGAVISGGRR